MTMSNDFGQTLSTRWRDACNLLLGVWLAVSPWALAYAGQTTPAWNAHAIGVVIAVAALAALVAFQQWEEWVNAALAAWLIVSPYLLGFSDNAAAFWNQFVAGLLVGGLAIWSAMAASHDGVHARG